MPRYARPSTVRVTDPAGAGDRPDCPGRPRPAKFDRIRGFSRCGSVLSMVDRAARPSGVTPRGREGRAPPYGTVALRLPLPSAPPRCRRVLDLLRRTASSPPAGAAAAVLSGWPVPVRPGPCSPRPSPTRWVLIAGLWAERNRWSRGNVGEPDRGGPDAQGDGHLENAAPGRPGEATLEEPSPRKAHLSFRKGAWRTNTGPCVRHLLPRTVFSPRPSGSRTSTSPGTDRPR